MTTLRISDAVRGEAVRVSESINSGERLALATSGNSDLLPDGIADILVETLAVLAQGGTVSIAAMPRELTTTEAARQLGVSRPTLMKWVKDGALASHMVRSHHRILANDVIAFAARRRAEQIQAFDRLREIDEELGIDN